jgi:putative inorganic carbon (HCO3(-)) transporter
MRDVALVLIFLSVLPLVFRHTWVGVLLWTWLSIMNPHRLTYGFAHDLPFAAITAGFTLLSVLWNSNKLKLPRDMATLMLVLFMLWMCITSFNAFNPDPALKGLDRTLKIMLMTLVAMAALRERKHIEWFLWVNVLSLGFFGFKGGLFTVATAGSYRVWGPPGSFIEGNNEIGLALIMMIPLANYLRSVSPHRWVRAGLLATMLLSAAAALGTQSRGAFLALCAMGLLLWWRSPRKMVGLVAVVGTAVMLVAFMPKSWEDRMRTIETYEEDGSATGRLNAWATAYNIANARFTGGGFYLDTPGVFAKYAPNPNKVITAHSIYFQALGEQGWVGLSLFLSLGALTYWSAARIRKNGLEREDTRWLSSLGGMVQVSVVGYAVGGAFLSLTYFDLPYNIMVVAIAAKHWLLDERWRTESRGIFGAAIPVALIRPKAVAQVERAR